MLKIIKYIPIFILSGFLVFAGLALIGNSTSVKADSGDNQPLDCLSCHQVDLNYHDALGTGNEACWTCHVSTDMTKLTLKNGTELELSQAPQLCGECHEQRYSEWKEGTHGLPLVAQANCVYCHNPHQPEVNLTGITLPHPDPTPPPPSVPINLIMIGVITIIVLAVIFVVALRRQRVE